MLNIVPIKTNFSTRLLIRNKKLIVISKMERLWGTFLPNTQILSNHFSTVILHPYFSSELCTRPDLIKLFKAVRSIWFWDPCFSTITGHRLPNWKHFNILKFVCHDFSPWFLVQHQNSPLEANLLPPFNLNSALWHLLVRYIKSFLHFTALTFGTLFHTPSVVFL
jgi:hypothetical protein